MEMDMAELIHQKILSQIGMDDGFERIEAKVRAQRLGGNTAMKLAFHLNPLKRTVTDEFQNGLSNNTQIKIERFEIDILRCNSIKAGRFGA
jgi:hypothetical protein